MDLRETWSECVDWVHLAEDKDQWRAVVNSVMSLWVQKKKKKDEFFDQGATVVISGMTQVHEVGARTSKFRLGINLRNSLNGISQVDTIC